MALKLKTMLDTNPSIVESMMPLMKDPKMQEAMESMMKNETIMKKVTNLHTEILNLKNDDNKPKV